MNDKAEIKKGRILIVDDEESIRSILSKYLAMLGYFIDTAEDGIKALKKLEEYDYDLVLTDLKMPNLDGRELLRQMADRFPQLPKIVLTGLGTNEDIILAQKSGAYDFLTKPIMDFDILNHSIERALEKKHLNDERNRYIEQQTQINEIISMLNRGKDTGDIFQKLTMTMKKVINFNRLALSLIDDNEDKIITKLVHSDRPILLGEGEKVPLLDSSLKDSVDSKKVILINDLNDYLTEHKESRNAKLLVDEGMNSSLVLPLIIKDRTRGFLIFASVESDFFGEEHLSFLESVVGQISFSIERGELLGELEMHTRNLEELVKVRTHEVLKIQKTTIFALSSLAEARDLDTGEHLERMRKYSILLAQISKYSGKEKAISNQYLRDLYDSSILHDIGKVGIPDNILLKPGPLTEDEFSLMKKHTNIGYNSLRHASKDLGNNTFLKMAMDITLYHHECWDGSGYPEGLIKENIPLAARIVAIGDVYDALTSVRPYKSAYTHEESIEIMKKESFRFDPVLFEIFLQNNSEFNQIRKEFS